ALPAQAKILFGDPEAILRKTEHSQALDRIRRIGDKDAVALRGPPPHPTAQLMQLREPEAFRMLDDHHGRVRHIDSDFDNGRRDQDVDLPRGERPHDAVLLFGWELTVEQGDAQTGEYLRPEIIILLRGRPQIER